MTDMGHTGGSEPSDVAGARGNASGVGEIRRLEGLAPQSRGKSARMGRRAAQFSKFKLTELNLVPLVDTLVSIVFFALTTAVVGEMLPVIPGINLPESRVGNPALTNLTLGVGPQITLGGRPIISTAAAAQSKSNVPGQPLVIPVLYTALKGKADSLRTQGSLPANQSVTQALAIQGDRTMRYDLLSRMIMTARLAGFRTISLQVTNTGADGATPAAAPPAPGTTAGVAPTATSGAPSGPAGKAL